MWQPLWNGSCTTMTGVFATFPNIADTAGNVLSFALYADRGDLWPGALLKVLGDMPTTTTVANTGRTQTVSAPLTPNTVYWLAMMPKGGTLPTLRTNVNAHPLLGLPDTTFVRTTSPSQAYNYLYYTTPDGVYPATAGNETVLQLAQGMPRVAWIGT